MSSGGAASTSPSHLRPPLQSGQASVANLLKRKKRTGVSGVNIAGAFKVRQ